jgi:hypothetical protein
MAEMRLLVRTGYQDVVMFVDEDKLQAGPTRSMSLCKAFVSWEGERGLGRPAGAVGSHCELG